MRLVALILNFCFLLLLLNPKLLWGTPSNSKQVLFGIRLSRLEEYYVRLLFDNQLPLAARKSLRMQLSAVQLHLGIEPQLTRLHAIDSSMGGISLDRSYKQIRRKIERKGPEMIGMRMLCEMWDFALKLEGLDQLMEGTMEVMAGRRSIEKDPLKIRVGKKHNCPELDDDEDNYDQPEWVRELDTFVTQKHLEYLQKLIEENDLQRALLSNISMQDDGKKLGWRIWRMNVMDEFEKLRATKELMKRWMLDLVSMAQLELAYPLIMGLDVIDHSTLKILYKDMLLSGKDCRSEFRLEIAILFGQIWAYFREYKNKPDVQQTLDKMWHLFQQLLQRLPELMMEGKMEFNKNTIGQMQNLAKFMATNFGELPEGMARERSARVVEYYEKVLVELWEEDGEFREKWQSAPGDKARTKLVELFKIGENGGGKLVDRCWEILNMDGSYEQTAPSVPKEAGKITEKKGARMQQISTFLNVPKVPSMVPSQLMMSAEKNEAQKAPPMPFDFNKIPKETIAQMQQMNALINAPKRYQECPEAMMPSQDAMAMDKIEAQKDPDSFFVTSRYFELLNKVKSQKDLEKYDQMVGELSLSAANWYYKQTLRELFEVANKLPNRGAKFQEIIEQYREIWREMANKMLDGEEEDMRAMLCLWHMIAFNLATNPELLAENEQWKKHILERMTPTGHLDSKMEDVLILPSPEDGMNDNAFCKDPMKIARVADKFRIYPWDSVVHTFCLSRLLPRFVSMQLLFCHGNGNDGEQCSTQGDCPEMVHNAKERLRWLVHENVLERLEALQPEIMHYESPNSAHLSALYTTMLQYKSGTELGISYEMRITFPGILATLNGFEANFAHNCQLAMAKCKLLLGKIIEAKNRFYGVLREGVALELRRSMCRLIHFNKFLGKNSKTAQNETEILKWNCEGKCKTDEQMGVVFLEHRESQKKKHFDFLKKAFAIYEWSAELIRMLQGARFRLKRFINNDEMYKELVRIGKLEDPTMFTDPRLLRANYEDILLTNNDIVRIAGALRVETSLFVRWMEAKLGMPDPDSQLMAKRLDRAWRAQIRPLFELAFDRSFDCNNVDEIENELTTIRGVSAESKRFVDKMLRGKMKCDPKYIGNTWISAVNRNTKRQLAEEIEDQNSEDDDQMVVEKAFMEWMQQMHFETLKKLIGKDAKFRERLEKALKKSENVVIFGGLLGSPTKVNELMKLMDKKELIGENSNSENVENGKMKPEEAEIETDQKEEEQGKKKKKKKRAKKNKNKGDQEEEKENLISKMEVEPHHHYQLLESPTSVFDRDSEWSPTTTTIDQTSEMGTSEFWENEFGREEEDEKLKSPKSMVTTTTTGGEEYDTAMDSFWEHFEALTDPADEEGDMEWAGIEGVRVGDFAEDMGKWYGKLLELVAEKTENDADGKEQELGAKTNAILRLIDVGIYANEIWHRLDTVRELRGIWGELGIKEAQMEEWEKSWEHIRRVELSRRTQWADLCKKLREILGQIVDGMDNKVAGQQQEEGSVRAELQERKLAEAIVADPEMAERWEKLEQNGQKMLSDGIFPEGMKLEKFERNLNMLRKRNTQLLLNEELFQKYKGDRLLAEYIEPNSRQNFEAVKWHQIPKGWQQIAIDEGAQNEMTNLIQNFLRIDEWKSADEHREKALREIREIFKDQAPETRFEVSDWHLLVPQKSNEQIKVIVIMPEAVSLEHLFGKELCRLDKPELCKDQTLYCILCKHPKVSDLNKQWWDRVLGVPVLRMVYLDIPLDIPFVTVPGISQLPRGTPYNSKQIGTFLKIMRQKVHHQTRMNPAHDEGMFWATQRGFDEEKAEKERELKTADAEKEAKIKRRLNDINGNSAMLFRDRAIAMQKLEATRRLTYMLKALADFGISAKIVELLLDQPLADKSEMLENNLISKFRICLAYLERWAKSNFIFNEQMGCFNMDVLMVMLAKLFLLYPMGTAPFLIQQFFVTYSTWKWPVPVQLTPIGQHGPAYYLSWSQGREWIERRRLAPQNVRHSVRAEQSMPVIAPTFPEQNLANGFSVGTAKVVRGEMRKALKQIRMKSEDGGEGIIRPLESKKFTRKYGHFIVVKCNAAEYLAQKFCEFVGDRIRHELLDIVENPLAKWIQFCHQFPQLITSDDEKTENSKYWLVGIELVSPMTEFSKFKTKLRSNLKKKFDQKIRRDFEAGELNGEKDPEKIEKAIAKMKLELQSEYVEGRERLTEWRITPNLY